VGDDEAVRPQDGGSLGIDQSYGDINAILLDHDTQELPLLELHRINVDLSAPDLVFQGQAVREGRSGRRLRLRSAEEHREERGKEPEHIPAEVRAGPAENGRRAHSVFNLGGFTTLVPAPPSRPFGSPESHDFTKT
jgi:hypothetical protein